MCAIAISQSSYQESWDINIHWYSKRALQVIISRFQASVRRAIADLESHSLISLHHHRPIEINGLYLPLYKVADTTLYSQGIHLVQNSFDSSYFVCSIDLKRHYKCHLFFKGCLTYYTPQGTRCCCDVESTVVCPVGHIHAGKGQRRY